MKLNSIELPNDCNYIAAFLTFYCQLRCSYCINYHDKLDRELDQMSRHDWVRGLSRFITREDLPITLQGGEPTVYPGFFYVANGLSSAGKRIDLLTNGMFVAREFMDNISPTVFERKAPYACIRFSLHNKTLPMELGSTAVQLLANGYSVGIWGLDHPDHERQNEEMRTICENLGMDFRLKEFLGFRDGKRYGTYKYCNAIGRKGGYNTVLCKGSEVLINPEGNLFRCHADLYANRNPYAHILDKEVIVPGYRMCNQYGNCNPCDVKKKTNRLQQDGYCAVSIKPFYEEVTP